MILSNIFAFVYRKPGIEWSDFGNGKPDDPAPPFFGLKYRLTLIREDKVRLVYWTGFIGIALWCVPIIFGALFAAKQMWF